MNRGMYIDLKGPVSKWNLFLVSKMFEGRISSQFIFALHTLCNKIFKRTLEGNRRHKGSHIRSVIDNNWRFFWYKCFLHNLGFAGNLFHGSTLALEFAAMNQN